MSSGKAGRGNVKKVNRRNARIYYHEAFLLIINFNLYFPFPIANSVSGAV